MLLAFRRHSWLFIGASYPFIFTATLRARCVTFVFIFHGEASRWPWRCRDNVLFWGRSFPLVPRSRRWLGYRSPMCSLLGSPWSSSLCPAAFPNLLPFSSDRCAESLDPRSFLDLQGLSCTFASSFFSSLETLAPFMTKLRKATPRQDSEEDHLTAYLGHGLGIHASPPRFPWEVFAFFPVSLPSNLDVFVYISSLSSDIVFPFVAA